MLNIIFSTLLALSSGHAAIQNFFSSEDRLTVRFTLTAPNASTDFKYTFDSPIRTFITDQEYAAFLTADGRAWVMYVGSDFSRTAPAPPSVFLTLTEDEVLNNQLEFRFLVPIRKLVMGGAPEAESTRRELAILSVAGKNKGLLESISRDDLDARLNPSCVVELTDVPTRPKEPRSWFAKLIGFGQ